MIIWCLIKFLRDLHDPLLTVRVRQFKTFTAPAQIIIQERLGDVLRDAEKRLILGSIAITRPLKPGDLRASARHSIWGPVPGTRHLEIGQHPIIGQAKSCIEISVDWYMYRIYAATLDPNREDTRRIFTMTEDATPKL